LSRNALATLIRVRRVACDDAQRALVSALAAEARAQQLAHKVERAIARETEAASDTDSSDAMVEAFGAWLPGARRELEDARRALLSTQAEAMRARAELTASRTALESVEALQKQRYEAARQAAERNLQRELDDRPQTEAELGDGAAAPC
jgi:flagellar biosynthesis chaperone FliJ